MRTSLRRVLMVGLVLAGVGIAVLIIGYVFSGPDRGGRIEAAGLLLAVLGFLGSILSWGWNQFEGRHAEPAASTSTQVENALALLAERTLQAWSEQLVRRGIQTPAPVRVRWSWAHTDIALPRSDLESSPELGTDPAPLFRDQAGSGHVLNSGLVTRLHDEVYARLRHGRLVLIGPGGAGKTAAMILLLVEALQRRAQAPEPARVPVPVWLTLGSWDPSATSVREWVTATMARDHPYLRAVEFGPNVPGQLLDSGRIALFLDGLDEMPDGHRNRALERLRTEAARLRVTLTSRPEQYRGTMEAGRDLPYAAVIELRPVGPKAAARYLLDGQTGRARQAWQQVTDYLQANPDSALARTLTTPLTLSLGRSLYAGSDPVQLLAEDLRTEQAIRAHLLDEVLVTAYPEPRERALATYWLSWCAHQMNSQPAGVTRDLRWWDIPRWVVNRRFRVLFGIMTGTAMALAFWTVFRAIPLSLTAAAATAIPMARRLVQSPRSTTLRRPTRPELRRILRRALRLGLYGGLTGMGLAIIGFISMWTSSAEMELGSTFLLYVTWGSIGFLLGPVVGFISLLVDVWSVPIASSADVTPLSIYRRDLGGLLVPAFVYAIAAGSLLTLAMLLLLYGEGDWLLTSAVFTIGFGLGFLVGAVGGARPSLLIVEAALWIAHGRRVRFLPLLETALERQVLRQAGAVYQFRHAELQDRLADQHRH